MKSRKGFLKLIALCMAFAGICSVSLGVHAENDEESTELSELPFVQESIDEEEDSSEFSEEESSETDESEFSDDEEEESSEDDEESSEEENEYSEFEESSYYYETESSYYYYEESESSPESSFEPVIYYYGTSSQDEDSETTEYYYEESSEPSTYRETSIDNSELTSRDWEYLRKRLEAETSNKSSDNAIRDIKDGESSQNDSINYLMWGLILIGMGLVIIGFIICSTISTKRKLTENLRKKSKKSGTKIQK